MVIETRANVVLVSGEVYGNAWAAIRTAADYVYADYPQGVIIDFTGLRCLTEQAEAFLLDAFYDIEWHGLPFLLTHLEPALQARLESLAPKRHLLSIEEITETQRINRAIFSEAWWEKLWGST